MTQPAGFLPQAEQLAEGFVAALFTTHHLIGLAVILAILLQVGVVLLGLYMRPVRTGRQVLKLLAILCLGLAICGVAIWLLWRMERT